MFCGKVNMYFWPNRNGTKNPTDKTIEDAKNEVEHEKKWINEKQKKKKYDTEASAE